LTETKRKTDDVADGTGGPTSQSAQQRVRVRFGLRTKLLLWTLLAVNVAFLSVWFSSTTTARRGMVALADANLGLGAQNLADSVTQMVNDTYADGLTTSRLDLPAQAIETGDPKNIAWYSDEMVQQKGRYAAILVANKDGKIVSANTVGKDGAKLRVPLLGRSLGDAEWARAALAVPRGQGVWIPPSKPAFFEGAVVEDDGVVGFCFPVFDILDERIGTLTILLSMGAIGKQLDGYVSGKESLESAALVLDDAGAPIALPLSLPFREGWRRARIDHDAAGHAKIVDPNGASFFVVERPIAGPGRTMGWRVAALKTAAALEAPVDQIGDRLLVVFLVAVLLTTAVLVLVGSRLIRPIQQLTEATRKMGKASEYEPLPVRTSDEVGVLTASFNDVFRSLREHEEGLEEKVAERTREVETARGELTDILDNMRQGIFTVGPDGRIGSQFSAFTRQLFDGVPIAGADALELLQVGGQGDRHAEARMRFWFENIFGGDQLQWLLASQDGVKELAYRPKDGGAARFLELEYAPVFKEGAVSKVMVIAKDVTELRTLEQEMDVKERSHQKNLARITEIAAMDADLFATFLDESRALLARCDRCMETLARNLGDRAAIDEVFRAVHTLKGNARIFHVSSVQDLSHEVEEEFQKLREDGSSCTPDALAGASSRIEALHAEFGEIERIGRQVLFGERSRRRGGPSVQVAESRVLELRRRYKELARALPPKTAKKELEGLEGAVQALTLTPLGELFDRLGKVVLDTARDVGKQVQDLEVVGEDVAVDAKLIDKLRDVLVHAVRNAVDHGIESPEQRRAAGKPEKGRLKLAASMKDATLVLSLSDDGAGFDLERVKRRALDRGAVTEAELGAMADADALELAFLPGVTTSDKVTEVSGRGVGMDVVRSVMGGLHGTARVSSSRGAGSTLTLEIPADYRQHL
jgi:HPt (histidine-containing phosphotransfer) domain-containing protein/PAS domain-containing protein